MDRGEMEGEIVWAVGRCHRIRVGMHWITTQTSRRPWGEASSRRIADPLFQSISDNEGYRIFVADMAGFCALLIRHRARKLGQDHGGLTQMGQILRNNGLSFVLIAVFLSLWFGQALVGRADANQERTERGLLPMSVLAYLTSGHFIEATGENWESEFLQMGAFVWLTSFLFQKGSPESNDPRQSSDEEGHPTAASPWPARRGGWVRAIYARSLTLAFVALFLFSFWLHALGGSWEYSEEQAAHGQPPVSLTQYLGTTRFWFESLQNWQSEFLAIASMVVLTIFLRQKGSPESKPVDASHASNE